MLIAWPVLADGVHPHVSPNRHGTKGRSSLDPVMRWIVGGEAVERQAASTSQMGRFETELLANDATHEALAYNLANFMRTLALPKEVEHWSSTTIREKLAKIGAKVVSHGRYVTFQLAEGNVPRDLFRKIPRLIDDLRPRPAPTMPREYSFLGG